MKIPKRIFRSHVLNQRCLQCRSAGKQMDWDGNHYTIEELTDKSFGGVDIALFSAGGSISKKYAPLASDAGCTVSRLPDYAHKLAVCECCKIVAH